jgi:hypothetical protein
MEEEEWLRLGVAATLSAEYAADQRRFLGTLAAMLERILPEHTHVKRGGGLFARTRPVRELQVQLGEHRYSLRDPGKGKVTAQKTLISRGIALSTQELAVGEWISELCADLEALVGHNQEAAEALRRISG